MAKPSDSPPAPLWRRLAALLYDLLLLAALSFGYSALALLGHRLVAGPLAEDELLTDGWWFQLGWLALIVGFYVYFWRRGGQTLGMRAWRIRLQSEDGALPSFKQCLLRCVVAPPALAVAGAGYLWCLIDRQGATLPDRLSHTRVVVTPKVRKNPLHAAQQPGPG